MYNATFKRDVKGKLLIIWLGPYLVDIVFDNGTVLLVTIDESFGPLFANGNRLRLYHNTISKDAFTSNIGADLEYQLEQGHESFSSPFNP